MTPAAHKGTGYLPFWGLADQIANRGSVGVAHTVSMQEGIAHAATELFRLGSELLLASPLDRTYEPALQRLTPEQMTHSSLVAIESCPLLAEEDRNTEGLRRRLALVKELSLRVASLKTQDLRRQVRETVAADADKFRSSLQQCFDANPNAAAQVIQEARVFLGQLQWPRPAANQAKRLSQIVAVLEELPSREEALVPEAMQRVTLELLEAGWGYAAAALGEAVSGMVADEWARQLPVLLASLHEIEQRCIGFQRQTTRLVDLLAENERQLQEEQQNKASSVALPLPGATSDEAISGMKAANHCSDTPELAAKLRAQLELKLRELARTHHPHLDAEGASFPSLLLDLPAAEIACLWSRLIDEHLGQGHSLYAQVAAIGPETVADFLWRRAAPTCFFLGRDHERFGMNIAEVAIVRLPPTIGVDDPPTRDRLAELFRGYSKNCHVTPGARDEREISVSRLNCGFVIGIESSNLCLIHAYQEAAEHGHLPHLVGILSDSPLGGPSPAYLSLLDGEVESLPEPIPVADERDRAPQSHSSPLAPQEKEHEDDPQKGA